MNCTLNSNNGQSEDYDTLQEAMTAILAQYPDGYAVDAGGFNVDADTADNSYDVRGRRAAMVWASEAESENDPGVNAVATLSVEEK